MVMDEPADLSYERFSRSPEYLAEGRGFVASLLPARADVLLDLACGTGSMTDLLLERAFERDWSPAPVVIGIDQSRESLRIARAHLGVRWPQARVALMEGTAERLPFPSETVDIAVMGNAIHLFEDKDALVDEIVRVLRPGGLFAFNTSFFAGTFVPGTEGFYTEWLKQALTHVRQQGARKQRDRSRPAFALRWLSPEEYAALLAAHGIEVSHLTRQTVDLTRRSMEGIAAYSELAQALLSGYPTRLASQALVWAAGPAFEIMGAETLPRYWLDVVGVRR